MSIICPLPLATATTDEYYTWFVYGDCAVPCPTIEYTTSEWNALREVLTVLSVIALVLSFFSFVGHLRDYKRFYIQIMFIGGFFLQALVTAIFFLANYNNDVVCSGNAHFIEHGSLCVFQASSLIFLFIWVEMWSVIFVYDLYLHVTSQVTKADVPRRRFWYTAVAFTTASIITAIPLASDNVGFDPQANIPLCLFMISENKNYFWFLFFTPMCLLILAAIVVAIMVAVKMNQIFVNSSITDVDIELQHSPHSNSHAEKERESDHGLRGGGGIETTMHMGNGRGSETVYDAEYRASHDQHHHRPSDDEYYPDDRQSNRESTATVATTAIHDGHGSGGRMAASASASVGNPMQADNNTEDDSYNDHSGAAASDVSLSMDGSVGSVKAVDSDKESGTSAATGTLGSRIYASLSSFLPKTWQRYLARTWRYNGMAIIFVMTFCLTTLLVAPMVFQLFYVTWEKSVHAAEDYVECLLHWAAYSPYYGVPQNQEAVTEFAQGQCGGDVPDDRPNMVLMYITLIWACSYGIVPALIFGFGGLEKKAMRWLSTRCGFVYSNNKQLAQTSAACGSTEMDSNREKTDSASSAQ